MPRKPTHYETLGVFRDATPEEIKRAYLHAAQRLHPDKNKAVGETELFLDAPQAYEILSNPERRAAYDATLPPDENLVSPLRLSVQYSRPALIKTNEAQLVYALLEVMPRKKSEEASGPPLNVCLVLDRSTSMKGVKMDVVKTTAIQLMRNLRPRDVLSVVAFSDRAEVMVPAALQSDRTRLEARIQMIQPGGATEMFQGLDAGVREVRRNLDKDRVNHIILLTDGHTYGDEVACQKLAAQTANEGIGISTLGIGEEWNDSFLDTLASQTGGNCLYVSSPQDIQRILAEKFNALAQVYADEVILDFRSDPGVELNYAFRLQPETGGMPTGNPLRLGPILHDTHLSVLFEFLIHPQAVEEQRVSLVLGNLRASIITSPVPFTPMRIDLVRQVTSEPGPEPPPPQILQALSRLTLYRMQERARSEIDAGQFDRASRRLEALATQLLSQGQNALSQTAMLEAENIRRTGTFSMVGEKQIKYGTRALLLTGSQEAR